MKKTRYRLLIDKRGKSIMSYNHTIRLTKSDKKNKFVHIIIEYKGINSEQTANLYI